MSQPIAQVTEKEQENLPPPSSPKVSEQKEDGGVEEVKGEVEKKPKRTMSKKQKEALQAGRMLRWAQTKAKKAQSNLEEEETKEEKAEKLETEQPQSTTSNRSTTRSKKTRHRTREMSMSSSEEEDNNDNKGTYMDTEYDTFNSSDTNDTDHVSSDTSSSDEELPRKTKRKAKSAGLNHHIDRKVRKRLQEYISSMRSVNKKTPSHNRYNNQQNYQRSQIPQTRVSFV